MESTPITDLHFSPVRLRVINVGPQRNKCALDNDPLDCTDFVQSYVYHRAFPSFYPFFFSVNKIR